MQSYKFVENSKYNELEPLECYYPNEHILVSKILIKAQTSNIKCYVCESHYSKYIGRRYIYFKINSCDFVKVND